MRPERVASALQSVVDGLRSSNRRVWWTSFVIVSLLTGLWVLADPPYAGPDEQAPRPRKNGTAILDDRGGGPCAPGDSPSWLTGA